MELDYAPNFKIPLFRCQWVKLTGGGVTVDKEWNDNSGPQQYWVQRRTIRPCCRCESGVLCERHVYKIKERKKRRHQLNDQ